MKLKKKFINLMKYMSILLLVLSGFIMLTGCGILATPKEPVDDKAPLVKVDNLTQYDFTDSLKTNGPLTTKGLPSKGDVNVLVVPISFNPQNEDPNLIGKIKKAFNGNTNDTGYYSVKEFYKISSYNQLNLNFEFVDDLYGLDPYFDPKYYPRDYEIGRGGEYGSTMLFKEIIRHYDSVIDYSRYDNDKDGYIDSVWMVYTHPVSTKNGDDFWWAYVTCDQEVETFDSVKGYYYGFAGTDFLNPNFFTENKDYDYSNIKIDTHTFIHETGHMFGLDDYYDYDSILGIKNGGTYGLDYMDFNYGDHGPINKLLLDWVNPIIVNDICDVEIKPYQTTGEVYLVTKNFTGTIYDSYYLVINYSNDLLYKADPYFSRPGILVYEVNAQKNIVDGKETFNGGTYDTGFKYDNSDEEKLFVNLLRTSSGLSVHRSDLILTTNEYINLSNVRMKLVVNQVLDNGNISISFK